MQDVRLTMQELLFIKKELEENKYARDGREAVRKAVLTKIDKIIQNKIENQR